MLKELLAKDMREGLQFFVGCHYLFHLINDDSVMFAFTSGLGSGPALLCDLGLQYVANFLQYTHEDVLSVFY